VERVRHGIRAKGGSVHPVALSIESMGGRIGRSQGRQRIAAVFGMMTAETIDGICR
jgi:hypothetical protein